MYVLSLSEIWWDIQIHKYRQAGGTQLESAALKCYTCMNHVSLEKKKNSAFKHL